MIKKIDKIKNHRIFRNFKWNNGISEFEQYNLFFGLNGSGKSTLVDLFDCLSNKNCSFCEGSEFSITTDTSFITNQNISSSDENIYVFNENFIKTNLAEFSNLKGIVYLSDKNIELKKQLDEKKEKYKSLEKEKLIAEQDYSKKSKEFETLLSAGAKNIKEEFHVIGGIGNVLSNYNKTLFQADISNFSDFLKSDLSTIQLKCEIDNYKDILKDEIKQNMDPIMITRQNIELLTTKTFQLLSKSLKKSLSEDLGSKLFDWLYEGYKLNSGNVCKYCGNVISSQRITELKILFNDELIKFKEEVQKLLDSFACTKIIFTPLNSNNFYKNNLIEFNKLLSMTTEAIASFNNYIDIITSKLKEKLTNPYENISIDINEKDIIATYKNIFSNIEKMNELIKLNNESTSRFAQEQNKALIQLRKLYVYENYKKLNLSRKHQEYNSLGKNCKKLESDLFVLNQDMSSIESDLIDVIKAGNNFNTLLTQFLGRNEIELKYDHETKGYKIIRKESNLNAKNLSEGEKTAIAFVYFLTKVKENGNLIQDSIIVFDDPISSLDSNHIFNAYSFIISYFDDAKQLFVLTHNFTFFKLLRRHFGNEKHSKNFYFINNNYISIDSKRLRTAEIVMLPKSILQASSEYPYLLDSMIKFTKANTQPLQIELQDYLTISNTSRKVLESFCSFKVPHLTNNLKNSLLELYKINKPDSYALSKEELLQCERIYKFLNSFSHENSYYNDEDFNSLLGETYNVVSEILDLIKKCDEKHYNGILKQIDGLN